MISEGPISDAQALRNFFPATSEGFVEKCGTVAAVQQSDFEDSHRRRHLQSFKKSCEDWLSAPEKLCVENDKTVEFMRRLIALAPETPEEFQRAVMKVRREVKIAPSKSQMLSAYETLEGHSLEAFMVKKVVRTHSVLTSPGTFSCPKDCHYCPNEPGQPRSYLSTEPAVLRANQNGWDPALQFWDRGLTLYNNGHIIDKIEVLVLGGTWSGYPKAYQEEFIRDLFYAANTFHDFVSSLDSKHFRKRGADGSLFPLMEIPESMRGRLSLEEEQFLNENAACRETRPDHISQGELRRLRRFGCTRVQIGVQHTDNRILEKINRGCKEEDTIRALRLLKDSCFKVDIHLMPDLPGSCPETDKIMFERVLSSPTLQADQWKIYPCEVTPFSVIERWYKEGEFHPYAEKEGGQVLAELLVRVKTAVHPWIRLNRVVRDIPNPSIIAGNDRTNLRQILLSCMLSRGLLCRCLRCREVKTAKTDKENTVLKIRKYSSLGGDEYFLSIESEDELNLFGFLRLRIRDADLNKPVDASVSVAGTFPELTGCGLVRELHVYGQVVRSSEQKHKNDNRSQHTGFGKRLLVVAEILSWSYGLRRMAVIAGVGTRNYYRKFGYEVKKWFMTKELARADIEKWAADMCVTLPLSVEGYTLSTDLGRIQGKQMIDEMTSSVQPEVKMRQRLSKKGGRAQQTPTSKKPDALTGIDCIIKEKSRMLTLEHVCMDKITLVRVDSNNSFAVVKYFKSLLPKSTGVVTVASLLILSSVAFFVFRQRKKM